MKEFGELIRKPSYVTKYFPDKIQWYDKKVPLFGVELELEGLSNVNFTQLEASTVAKVFNGTADASLRDGVEYVSKVVHNKMLDNFWEAVNVITSKRFDRSIRCSTHVHINARDLPVRTIRQWIAVYAVVEDILFTYCNANRKGNNYCYSITRTQPRSLSFRDRRGNANNLKYCAVNIGALFSKGTLEFRHLEGVQNKEHLQTWLKLLFDVYNYALNVDDNELKHVLYTLSSESPYEHFLNSVFGENIQHLNLLELREAMEDNVTWAKLYLYHQ